MIFLYLTSRNEKCDNMPDTAGPHYLNFLYQLVAIRSSRSSSHLRGYRERVPERNSHTATRNADSSSRAGWPGFWVHKSQLPFQQLLYLTVAFSWLSLTPICWLRWDLVFPRLLPVSSEISHASPQCWFRSQNWQKNPLTGAYPHTQN